jgi:hypothetical protein
MECVSCEVRTGVFIQKMERYYIFQEILAIALNNNINTFIQGQKPE